MKYTCFVLWILFSFDELDSILVTDIPLLCSLLLIWPSSLHCESFLSSLLSTCCLWFEGNTPNTDSLSSESSLRLKLFAEDSCMSHFTKDHVSNILLSRFGCENFWTVSCMSFLFTFQKAIQPSVAADRMYITESDPHCLFRQQTFNTQCSWREDSRNGINSVFSSLKI